jgi:methionyl-tRNA formyltransferase
MAPYPGAWMEMLLPGQTEKIILKIFEVEKLYDQAVDKPGTIVLEQGKTIRIALKDGYVVLKQIQAPGKKRMAAEEWLRGMR